MTPPESCDKKHGVLNTKIALVERDIESLQEDVKALDGKVSLMAPTLTKTTSTVEALTEWQEQEVNPHIANIKELISQFKGGKMVVRVILVLLLFNTADRIHEHGWIPQLLKLVSQATRIDHVITTPEAATTNYSSKHGN